MMSLFVLGLMPAFIMLQLFMGRSLKMILWHASVGMLIALPCIAIRALILDQGYGSDHVTFVSEWGVAIVLDYILPVIYLLIMNILAIRFRLILRDEVYLLTYMSGFFLVSNIVFFLYKGSADGSYEYLFRPVFYLLLTLLQARIYYKFSWIAFASMLLMITMAPLVSVYIFMNQNIFAGISITLLMMTTIGSWIFLQFTDTTSKEPKEV